VAIRIGSWLRSGNNNNANNANCVNSSGNNNNYNVSDVRAVRPALHSLAFTKENEVSFPVS
jgi:hypothetical protein